MNKDSLEKKIKVCYLKETKTIDELIESCLNMNNDSVEAFGHLKDLYKITKFSNYENAKTNILKWFNNIENSSSKIFELKKLLFHINNGLIIL